MPRRRGCRSGVPAPATSPRALPRALRRLPVSEREAIVRVAAKGDGVTARAAMSRSPRRATCCGADGAVEPGPHHADAAVPSLRPLRRVPAAAPRRGDAGRASCATGWSMPPRGRDSCPSASRRRISRRPAPAAARRLRAVNGGGRPLIGFNEAGSHRIVDMRECHVLRARAVRAASSPLRALLAPRARRYALEIELTLTDQGVDCGIKGLTIDGLEATEALLDFAATSGLARLTLDQGYGPETLWEPEPVTVTLSGVPVGYPAGRVPPGDRRRRGGAGRGRARVAGGCGAGGRPVRRPRHLRLRAGRPGARSLAAEAARDAHLACRSAAGRARLPVEAVHRDLFRNPLQPDELARLRRGACSIRRAPARASRWRSSPQAQCRGSPTSAATRRAGRATRRMLADAGYRLAELRPVGQFRWSTHVELASLFVR